MLALRASWEPGEPERTPHGRSDSGAALELLRQRPQRLAYSGDLWIHVQELVLVEFAHPSRDGLELAQFELDGFEDGYR